MLAMASRRLGGPHGRHGTTQPRVPANGSLGLGVASGRWRETSGPWRSLAGGPPSHRWRGPRRRSPRPTSDRRDARSAAVASASLAPASERRPWRASRLRFGVHRRSPGVRWGLVPHCAFWNNVRGKFGFSSKPLHMLRAAATGAFHAHALPFFPRP